VGSLSIIEFIPLLITQVFGIKTIASVRISSRLDLVTCHSLMFSSKVLFQIGLCEYFSSDSTCNEESNK